MRRCTYKESTRAVYVKHKVKTDITNKPLQTVG